MMTALEVLEIRARVRDVQGVRRRKTYDFDELDDVEPLVLALSCGRSWTSAKSIANVDKGVVGTTWTTRLWSPDDSPSK